MLRRTGNNRGEPEAANENALGTISALVGDAPPRINGPDGERANEYQAWAARLRAKREAKIASVDGDGSDHEDPTYWSTDALFRESALNAERDRELAGKVAHVHELLAELSLPPDAEWGEVTSAYRKFAKQHHPDRWADADELSQQLHADEMSRVNKAYSALERFYRQA